MTSPTGQLIVNADDFGWSRSVNAGIVESHVDGIVTSASLLAPGAAFDDAVALSAATPTLDVGVHLSFYRGDPVLPPDAVASLLGADGRFLGSWQRIVGRLVAGTFDLGQLEAELRAQIARVMEAGIAPTHLDGEKHLHLWPSVFDVVCRLASEARIPEVRVVREPFGPRPIPLGLRLLSRLDARAAARAGLTVPDGTVGVTDHPADMAALARILRGARAPRVEFVVHPGHVDAEFMELQRTTPNRLVASREEELAVLTDPEARRLVEAAGYSLVGRGVRTPQ
jgi:predicted glycoside hydrolase/deacetylase ChbG (UPF0249 family)